MESVAHLIEAYEGKPKSSRVVQSQAIAILNVAKSMGYLDNDGLHSLIVQWARKSNVSIPELASFVFREGKHRGLLG